MRVLLIGDVFGEPGREAVKNHLPAMRRQHKIDFALVNGENAAGGKGITAKIAQDFFEWGADVVTTGNHAWDQREIIKYIAHEPRLLRPANYPPSVPGRGVGIYRAPGGINVGVMQLQGRLFMNNSDCPFTVADRELGQLKGRVDFVLVDIHAEATSEKQALGFYLDGRVAALVGTHTHVQTADEKILPGGTAYITDLGMSGPHNSVIGLDKDVALKKWLTQMPLEQFKVAEGDVRLCGVLVDVNETTGMARSIVRVQEKMGQA